MAQDIGVPIWARLFGFFLGRYDHPKMRLNKCQDTLKQVVMFCAGWDISISMARDSSIVLPNQGLPSYW